MNDKSGSEQIDGIIAQFGGWKSDMIAHLRAIITEAAPILSEEAKWKMRTRPEGLPTWTHNGIVCFIEIWKDNIKLMFFNGSQLSDEKGLFNARLKSSTVRAIELHEGDAINALGIRDLVREAVELNAKKKA